MAGPAPIARMRYVAAYLLAVLGGNNNPTAKNIKKILDSVGIDTDDERVNKLYYVGMATGKQPASEQGGSRFVMWLLTTLKQGTLTPYVKNVDDLKQVISELSGKDVDDVVNSEEKKEEEKKEESEESDEDMGFGLFD
ncbi:60S acidic ribosomal protein P2 [Chelonia mydas]|uniref:Large ribosomal subunit protein P2 n=1 Tax=Chelonia mydas TaxID=8469 RepID=M7B9T8_CHEMY|nr:60S acidic ribosomal protein P2 [Chelonia mydas]